MMKIAVLLISLVYSQVPTQCQPFLNQFSNSSTSDCGISNEDLQQAFQGNGIESVAKNLPSFCSQPCTNLINNLVASIENNTACSNSIIEGTKVGETVALLGGSHAAACVKLQDGSGYCLQKQLPIIEPILRDVKNATQLQSKIPSLVGNKALVCTDCVVNQL